MSDHKIKQNTVDTLLSTTIIDGAQPTAMSVSHRCTALLAVLLPFASAVLRPAGPVLPTQRTYARTWPARAVALRPAEHSDLRRKRAARVLRMKAESADPDDGGSSAAVSTHRAGCEAG